MLQHLPLEAATVRASVDEDTYAAVRWTDEHELLATIADRLGLLVSLEQRHFTKPPGGYTDFDPVPRPRKLAEEARQRERPEHATVEQMLRVFGRADQWHEGNGNGSGRGGDDR